MGERNRSGRPNPVTLNVYPGGHGEYTMYLDDGVSRSSAPRRADNEGGDECAKDQYREVHITHKYMAGWGAPDHGPPEDNDGYPPPEKFFSVAVLHDPSEAVPTMISLNGETVDAISGETPESRAARLWGSDSPAWYHNETIHISFVKVFDKTDDIVLDVTAG